MAKGHLGKDSWFMWYILDLLPPPNNSVQVKVYRDPPLEKTYLHPWWSCSARVPAPQLLDEMPNLQGAAVRSLRPESWDFFGAIRWFKKLTNWGSVARLQICFGNYPPQMVPMMWRMSRKHAFYWVVATHIFLKYFFKFSPRKYLEKWSNLTFAYFSTGLKETTN